MYINKILLFVLLYNMTAVVSAIDTRLNTIFNLNPSNFLSFSLDRKYNTLLVGGLGFLLHIQPDFNQSTVISEVDSALVIRALAYSNTSHEFFICRQINTCYFVNASNITQNTSMPLDNYNLGGATISGAVIDTSSGTPSVYTLGHKLTPVISSNRFNLVDRYLMNNGISRFFTGVPSTSTIFTRNLINTFKFNAKLYFVIRHELPGTYEIRLMRVCNYVVEAPTIVTDFGSLMEVEVAICGAATVSDTFVSASIITKPDAMQYLALVFSNSGICMVNMTALDSYVTPANLAQLDWNTQDMNFIAAAPSFNLPCDLVVLNTAFYAMSSAAFNQAEQLVSSVYAGNNSTMGSVVRVAETRLEAAFSYFYIATSNGYLLKYYIEGNSAVNFSSTLIEALSISPFGRSALSLEFDSTGSVLLALTTREVIQIPVEDCGRYTDCVSCTADVDPICGWCSVTNTCSRRSQCADSALTHRWINDNTTNCFTLRSITPVISPINVPQTVTLEVTNLPELLSNDAYQCVFPGFNTVNTVNITGVTSNSNNTMLYGPTYGNTNITCQLPTGIPTPSNQDIEVSPIYLTSTASPGSMLYGQLSYTVYDCSVHSTCTACITTNSSCGWCVYDNTCTYTSALCANNAWIVTPMCVSASSVETQIYSVESELTIRILANNLPTPYDIYVYRCELTVDGTIIEMAPNRITSSTLNCTGSVSISSRMNTASIQLYWSNNTILNLSQHLTLINCSQLAIGCSSCFAESAMAPFLQCGWCSNTSQCVHQSLCASEFISPLSGINCPLPVIDSISPTLFSTRSNNISITITGNNLGTAQSEVAVTFSVPTITCDIVLYDIGTRIVCDIMNARSLLTGGQMNITAYVIVTRDGTPLPAVIAPANITFVFPAITEISREFGPYAGGTVITVGGIGLGLGTPSAYIKIGTTDVVVCSVMVYPTTLNGDITCVTQNHTDMNSAQFGLFTVSINSIEYEYISAFYELRPNPSLRVILPASSIQSGSIPVQFNGESMNAASQASISFYENNSTIACDIISSVIVNCTFPPLSVTTPISKRQVTVPLLFELTFDGYTTLIADYVERNNILTHVVTILPDPLFNFLDETFPPSDSMEYSFNIEFADNSPSYIGLIDYISVVVSSAETTYNNSFSYPPSSNLLRVTAVGLPVGAILLVQYSVEVRLSNFTAQVGTVSIDPFASLTTTLLGSAIYIAPPIGVIIIIIIIIIIILLIIVLVFRRRGASTGKVVEALLLEMDHLENNVAKACREGFTALNTELCDEVDLVTQGAGFIPFVSYYRFVMRIMFPGQTDHPVLHPVILPVDINGKVYFEALNNFHQLLYDKDFFIYLVNCIESNRSFSTRDRYNVASLFAVCMHDDMKYLTFMLKFLLEDIIQRMIAKERAKLLFRRNESVAEKLLSDWLAMTMYNYIIEGPGSALYLLYRATKLQTEKGPVDVITGEAKYCLAEEKILRQAADDSHELELEIETEEGVTVLVKLLDCDSITQAKFKIMDAVYKNVPISQRPLHTELDLEMRTARGAVGKMGLILRDSDHTSEVSHNWKRVNTLKHYGVTKQVFKLVPRHQKPHGGQVFDYTGTLVYDGSAAKNTAPNSAATLAEDKIWHLVKAQQENVTNVKSEKKLASDIFLLRLISTKSILQNYIDQCIDAILPDVQTHPDKLPYPVKFLFQFLEKQAETFRIEDEDVINAWKNNSVPLRFWVSLIKNPDFFVDVNKSETIDSTLTVISQVFIDCCNFGTAGKDKVKDTHTTKILFNKEVPNYRNKLIAHYDSLKQAPSVSEETIISRYNIPKGGDCFYKESALQALYSYAYSCREKLLGELLDDGFDNQVAKFEQICDTLSKHGKDSVEYENLGASLF